MTDRSARPHERYVILDGLRGLAACLVVIDHVPSETLRELVPYRAFAVDFFFVLSGFVLAHVYGRRFDAGLGPLGFMKARLLRFYPMMLVAVAIGAAAYIAGELVSGGDVPWGRLIISCGLGLLFLPTPPSLSFNGYIAFPVVAPSYTMFFELFANLAMAVIWRWLNVFTLSVLVAVSGAVLLLAANPHRAIDGGWAWFNFAIGFPRVMFSFFLGVLIWRLRNRLPKVKTPAWLCFLLLLGMLTLPGTGPQTLCGQIFIVFACSPLLLALGATAAEPKGRFADICLWAGAISYGFYLIHAPISQVLALLLARVGLSYEILDIWGVLLVIAVSGGAASVLHFAYDEPARAWLKRRLRV
jgi:peptidoglycan/LPS O-acetylase OafA/YrhL